MPVVTRFQTASLKQEAVPLNDPSVVEKRKVQLVVTGDKLEKLGLNLNSTDPSGNFPIVIYAHKMKCSVVHQMKLTKETSIYDKYAVAPDGYYWKCIVQSVKTLYKEIFPEREIPKRELSLDEFFELFPGRKFSYGLIDWNVGWYELCPIPKKYRL
jgi:hypothetical protein